MAADDALYWACARRLWHDSEIAHELATLPNFRAAIDHAYRTGREHARDAVRVEVAEQIATAIAKAGNLPYKPHLGYDQVRHEAYQRAVAIATEHAASPAEEHHDA